MTGTREATREFLAFGLFSAKGVRSDKPGGNAPGWDQKFTSAESAIHTRVFLIRNNVPYGVASDGIDSAFSAKCIPV
jgi:hypothetical protein